MPRAPPPCPVAAGMVPLLADVGSRIERAVETELQQTTIADLLEAYVAPSD